MSGQGAFLAELLAILRRCEIAHMVTGSVASSFHGEPRATRDIDLVVECDRTQLAALLAKVHARGWYVSDEAAADAVAHRRSFNVIDAESGWKADLLVRRDRAYSREEFGRRITASLLGEDAEPVPLVTPEDSILSKLEWFAQSSAEQQFRDALAIAAIHRGRLDESYLRRWAREIGVEEPWDRLLREIQ